MSMTLKELSILYAKKQPHQVNSLLEETPALERIPFEQASHDFWNVYDKVTSITGAGFVDMNSPLPKVDAASELEKLDLSLLGGEIEVTEDTAKVFGGPGAYFAKKEPAILRQTGMNTEKHILENFFQAYALKNSKAIDAGGTSTGNYSMIAVRFVPGETIGLYSPTAFSQGTTLQTLPINGGNVYKNSDGVLVYGVRYKGLYGIQIANPNSVAAIVNIKTGAIPTEAQIDDMLDKIRATNSNCYIFAHPTVLSLLNTYKAKYLNLSVGESGMDRRLYNWNGVPFIGTYNLSTYSKKTV